MIDVELPVVIERQPDYTTCGPTSLHAISEITTAAGISARACTA